MGIHSHDLVPDALMAVIDSWIAPSRLHDKHPMKWDGVSPLNEHLHNSEVCGTIHPDKISLKNGEEETEVQCFSVRSFPELWAQWNMRDLIGDFYSDFLRIPCPFITVFSFTFPNEHKQESQAAFKTARAIQQAHSGIARFMPSVISRERDWQFVMDKLRQGQKLVKAHYQVVLYNLPGEGHKCEQALKSLYKAKGWQLTKDQFVQSQSWLSCFPFTPSEGLSKDFERMGRLKTMVTWSCANLAPLQGEWRGMKKPCLMLFGRRGQPMFWNPFQNEEGNYNVAVIGKSGSGKSVFMQDLVASLRGAGGRVIIIDKGRSFKNSCFLQGGHFIAFDDKSDLCINPFSIISTKDFAHNQEYKMEVMGLINMMVRRMCRSVELTSDVENALIEQAIFTVWEAKGSTATISDVSEHLLTFADPRAKDLGLMLTSYTKNGLFGRFFEGTCNIPFDNTMMVFELEELDNKKDLQAIVMMLLMFMVSEKMYQGKRMEPISLVIDEAWELLQGKADGDMVEGVARRARKYLGNLITGTQSIDDYYKTASALAALNNSDWVCLLAQKPESIDKLKKEGKIKVDDAMERALGSLKMVEYAYSEVMIYGPSGWAVGRLMLDPYSMMLYTSKGEDFNQIEALIHTGMPLEEAVSQMADKLAKRNA